jgi:hypothetical protein
MKESISTWSPHELEVKEEGEPEDMVDCVEVIVGNAWMP